MHPDMVQSLIGYQLSEDYELICRVMQVLADRYGPQVAVDLPASERHVSFPQIISSQLPPWSSRRRRR